MSETESAPDEGIHTVQAFLEDKYDGMRAQLHCGDPTQPGRVAIYSRNREDITGSFPELAEAFAHAGETGAGALIFDGEILGWDLAESPGASVRGPRPAHRPKARLGRDSSADPRHLHGL